MKLNVLMMLAAIVTGVFGAAFVLIPGEVLAYYGATPDATVNYIGQLFGSALIVISVLTWVARNAADSDARQAIILAIFIGDAVGFVVALTAQLGGVVNALGWSTVVIYLLFTLGFGYFQFTKPATAS
jgi:hypothetical protein